jgi:hypothetical protein
MKRILLMPVLLVLGVAVGCGSAYATAMLRGPQSEETEADSAFVPTGAVLVPLVLEDGRLAGYTSFEVELQVPADKAEFVAARMPMLLHAINLRAFRAPLASGPDGMLPNIDQFRAVVMSSAPEAFGRGVVRHVAITQANPA